MRLMGLKMKKFEVIKSVLPGARYWVERTPVCPLALVQTKAKALKVCAAFNRHTEHWSAVTRNGMTIITVELRPNALRQHAAYIRAVGGFDGREYEGGPMSLSEKAAGVIAGLQGEVYCTLANHAIGPH